MTQHIRPAPIRKTVTVKAPPEAAFEVFTAGMGRWWRPDHHIGKAALRDVVAEPHVGGRWYEVGVDGSECDWGRVLVWDPPRRVTFAWQLNAEWRFDREFETELDVTFTPENGGTRVDLEHRYLERYAERAAAVSAVLDSPDGWTGALAAFAALAEVRPPHPA